MSNKYDLSDARAYVASETGYNVMSFFGDDYSIHLNLTPNHRGKYGAELRFTTHEGDFRLLHESETPALALKWCMDELKNSEAMEYNGTAVQ